MSRLFRRTAAVSITRETTPVNPTKYNPRPLGTNEILQITDLRIKFKIVRDFSKHPNSADIEIFNLAPETRADLHEKPLRVHLAGGYDGNNRLLAVGDVRFSMSKMEDIDWVTLLQIGDGARAFAHARVRSSFPKNTTYRQVITSVVNSMGMVMPPALARDAQLDKKIIAGYSAEGPAQKELTRLLAPFGYEWSIQNNSIKILGQDSANTNDPLPIDVEHGMIGTPEFGSPPRSGKQPHMTVKMLLYPELVPGDKILLKSKAKSGEFKLIKVSHTGDTAGGDWTTEVEIVPPGS